MNTINEILLMNIIKALIKSIEVERKVLPELLMQAKMAIKEVEIKGRKAS